MKVLLVGHVSVDVFSDELRIGGPPTFQAPLFLNWGYEVTILTSASKNFPFLRHPKLNIFNIPSEQTTTFEFELNEDGSRKLTLLRRASDLPPKLPFQDRFDLAIVSPICGEVSIDLLGSIRSQAKLVAGDVQGFIRSVDANGIVFHKTSIDWGLFSPFFDILKGSDEEMLELPPHPSFYYVQTRGANPVIICKSDQLLEFKIQSVPPSEIVDSTGSGDIFLASFSHAFIHSNDLKKAVEFGNRIAINNLFKKGAPQLQSGNES
ncbi:MAG: hypothetical protein D6732_14690 [Methanobacteriota archaeon]|nr:MAG: hypothetical protein D6732_14690 [Euryarchaeota archaeon]